MRGKPAPTRDILPDPKYQSVVLAKFINVLMTRGKKSVARKVMYTSLDKIQAQSKQEPLPIFELALKNVAPIVEVKSRRVGGSNYQVPVEVTPKRRQALAFRWILTAARSKKGRPMADKLAEELLAASQNQGDAIKKKQDVHRMAEANRAFAHFA
ncbi:MAG: 30S ribosomal protein S7 [Candidatus Kerfeldbacteria bacterium]|nr:30S ribosomal protein S7 [Candidatus Kerfeldbacteria bacterium]